MLMVESISVAQGLKVQLGLVADSVIEAIAKAGILGWLEDGSPLWRLLIPLWRLHLAQDQFCTTQGVQVGHRVVWLS